MDIQLDRAEGEDDASLDASARALCSELRDVPDVRDAGLKSDGTAPTGTKSAELVALGALWASVVAPQLPSLLTFVKDWLAHRETRKVHLRLRLADREVELDYNPSTMSAEDVERLAAQLIGRLEPSKLTLPR